MARLDDVKAKEAALKAQGLPAEEIATQIAAIESAAAWRVLCHFDPSRYQNPDVVPDGFQATGVSSGNLSYGFTVTMPDGTQTFLKVEKPLVKDTLKQRQELGLHEPLAELAEYLADNGVPTARPIRSGLDASGKPFNMNTPDDPSLPKEMRGLQVSLFQGLSGPAKDREAPFLEDLVAQAARVAGQFQRCAAEHFVEAKPAGIEIDSFGIVTKTEEIPETIAQFLADVGFSGRDVQELAAELTDGTIDFQLLIDKNNQYVGQELGVLGQALEVDIASFSTLDERIAGIKEAYLVQAGIFPDFAAAKAKFIQEEQAKFETEQKEAKDPKDNPKQPFETQFLNKNFADFLRKKPPVDATPEQAAFLEQGLKIAHLEQVQELSELAVNGKLVEYVDALATISQRHGDIMAMPRGVIHNDLHLGNTMEYDGDIAIIDFGEVTEGILANDPGLLLLCALQKSQGVEQWRDITYTPDELKPALAAYDLARGEIDGVPRLSEKEADNMFMIPAIMDVSFIASHVNRVVQAREQQEYTPDTVKVGESISWVGDLAKRVKEIEKTPFGQWLQETRAEAIDALLAVPATDTPEQHAKNLDALDLATFVLSPEVQEIAESMGALARATPSLDSKAINQNQSWAQQMRETSDKFHQPGDSREI